MFIKVKCPKCGKEFYITTGLKVDFVYCDDCAKEVYKK
jgi:ribosomal protein S27E